MFHLIDKNIVSMLYPVEETYRVRVVEGGWSQCLIDTIVFSFKVFLFGLMFFFSAWSAGMLIGKRVNESMSPSCVLQLQSAFAS